MATKPQTDASPYARKEAERLLDDLFTLMRRLRQGEELTMHHLVGLHADALALLRELDGFEDLIEKYGL